ncbi:methyltransferase domain-containing protein, partial [Bacillus cereus]|uniref:methyltransferase domain-containing protein n=1 Tax=Bacillus cereus TaxID=1396 RepID=UPI00203B9EBC|nr:methyltransferase domain-containing protein [Bacillus cereus]
MSIMLKSPNSKPSPRAGGIWRASSNRSTASTRCGWGYIAERSGGLFGKKVLDVGCGGGILAESMAREGATVTGLDMGPNRCRSPGCTPWRAVFR